MSTSKIVKGVAPVVGAVAMAGAAVAGPAAADTPTHAPALDTVTTHAAPAVTPVPPGSPGDENGNGLLDSSETPDNPDLPPSFQPPGSPGDENGNGQLDSSETPDNPDQS